MLAEIDPFWHKELHQSEMNHLQKLTPFDIKKFINQKWIIWHVLKHLLFRQKASPLLGWGISSRAAELIPTVIQRYFILHFFTFPQGRTKELEKGGATRKKNVTPPAKLLCAPLFRTPLPPYWAYNFKKVRKRRVHAPLVPPLCMPLAPPFLRKF